MIAYLKGKPIILNNQLILEVNGVGYGVKVAATYLQNLTVTGKNEEIELFIFTHVKEDKLELYGFEKIQDKETFELVLGVSGVGPSIALNLVTLGTNKLIEAVQNAQVSFFSSAPRVGKKLAQKIIIELRGKLGELKALDLGPKSAQYLEIYDALLALGFGEDRIHEVLNELETQELSTQEAIKLAMKKLGK